jgi:hypothetical protein
MKPTISEDMAAPAGAGDAVGRRCGGGGEAAVAGADGRPAAGRAAEAVAGRGGRAVSVHLDPLRQRVAGQHDRGVVCGRVGRAAEAVGIQREGSDKVAAFQRRARVSCRSFRLPPSSLIRVSRSG